MEIQVKAKVVGVENEKVFGQGEIIRRGRQLCWILKATDVPNLVPRHRIVATLLHEGNYLLLLRTADI